MYVNDGNVGMRDNSFVYFKKTELQYTLFCSSTRFWLHLALASLN